MSEEKDVNQTKPDCPKDIPSKPKTIDLGHAPTSKTSYARNSEQPHRPEQDRGYLHG